MRAQHSATEGSEEKPFDINDIIDMAMNITGRPEEPAEQRELSDTIQKMAESMAPDIFPPKTFEEMDDSERAASAVNMIEERLKNGGRKREEAQQPVQPVQAPEAVSQPEPEPVQPQVQAETISASQPEVEQQTFNNEDYGNGNVYDMFGQDDVCLLYTSKVNVDEAPEIAEKYGIDTIPTLLLFKNGEVAGTIVAPDSKAKIETFIQEYL